jgi:hypothetical protein
MTVAYLVPTLRFKSWLSSGIPNAFGTVATYQAGSVTPIATYVDNTGTTTNLNPLTLNARGEATIWCIPNVAYKFVEFDSLGNQIATTDQVVNSTLITLFGGVDIGTANVYILSFTANFSSLTNGIIIYFIAANTNTGTSTLTVNTFGTQSIVNPGGTALSAGQIVGGQVAGVIYYNGQWLLISTPTNIPLSGSFQATVTGGSNAPLTCAYSVSGGIVSMSLPFCAFTSTATTFTLTGMPTTLQPASNKIIPLAVMQNNTALISTGSAQFWGSVPGVITFLLSGNSGGWTGSGIKGIGYFATVGFGVTLSYSLL